MSDTSSSLTLQRLQAAIADLWWMSETDAPIEVQACSDLFSNGFDPLELLRLMDHESDTPWTEMTLDQLFEPAIRAQDWHGESEKAEVRQFRSLKSLILESLSDVHVLRVGDVNLDLYIVGQIENSQWMVLSTQAVET